MKRCIRRFWNHPRAFLFGTAALLLFGLRIEARPKVDPRPADQESSPATGEWARELNRRFLVLSTPHKSANGRWGGDDIPDGITLHTLGSELSGNVLYFARGNDRGVSAHLIVPRVGGAFVFADPGEWKTVHAHTGPRGYGGNYQYNSHWVGIEHATPEVRSAEEWRSPEATIWYVSVRLSALMFLELMDNADPIPVVHNGKAEPLFPRGNLMKHADAWDYGSHWVEAAGSGVVERTDPGHFFDITPYLSDVYFYKEIIRRHLRPAGRRLTLSLYNDIRSDAGIKTDRETIDDLWRKAVKRDKDRKGGREPRLDFSIDREKLDGAFARIGNRIAALPSFRSSDREQPVGDWAPGNYVVLRPRSIPSGSNKVDCLKIVLYNANAGQKYSLEPETLTDAVIRSLTAFPSHYLISRYGHRIQFLKHDELAGNGGRKGTILVATEGYDAATMDAGGGKSKQVLSPAAWDRYPELRRKLVETLAFICRKEGIPADRDHIKNELGAEFDEKQFDALLLDVQKRIAPAKAGHKVEGELPAAYQARVEAHRADLLRLGAAAGERGAGWILEAMARQEMGVGPEKPEDEESEHGCDREDPPVVLPPPPGGGGGGGGGGEPGGHPDDFFGVSTKGLAVKEARRHGNPSSESRLLVLLGGFYDGPSHFLDEHNVSHRFVTPGLLSYAPADGVLLVPSGALSGLSTSNEVRRSFDDFARRGGTIVVFSQPVGLDFSVLPRGEDLSGFGWDEDQACQLNSSVMVRYLPCFAGQSNDTPSFGVDGYFTKWPEDATVLLERRDFYQPSMLVYPAGKGRVFATSLYADWALRNSQGTKDEKALMLDLVHWLLLGERLAAGLAYGKEGWVKHAVANPFTEDAHIVELILRDSSSVERKRIQIRQIVPAGQEREILFAPPTRLEGVFLVEAVLLNARGEAIGRLPRRFGYAVSRYEGRENGFAKQGVTIAVRAQAVTERVPGGQLAFFQILLSNFGKETRWIRVQWSTRHNGDLGRGEARQFLPPGGTGIPLSFRAIWDETYKTTRRAVDVRVWDERGELLASTRTGFSVLPPVTEALVEVGEIHSEVRDPSSLRAEVRLQRKGEVRIGDAAQWTLIDSEHRALFRGPGALTREGNNWVWRLTLTIPEGTLRGKLWIGCAMAVGPDLRSLHRYQSVEYVPPPRLFQGKVLDLVTGSPVAKAKLAFATGALFTRENGRFEVPLVPAHHDLGITAEGYHAVTTSARFRDPRRIHPFFLVPSRSEGGDPATTAFLHGRIVNWEGSPVPHAVLVVQGNEIGTFEASADAHGEYRFPLSAGRPYTIQVMLKGIAITEVLSIRPPAGNFAGFDFSVPAARVRGTVRDLMTGEPIPGVELRIDESERIQADSSGTYSVLLPRGIRSLRVVDDRVEATERKVLVTVRDVEEADIYVIRKEYPATVRVTDRRTGKPIPGAVVARANAILSGSPKDPLAQIHVNDELEVYRNDALVARLAGTSESLYLSLSKGDKLRVVARTYGGARSFAGLWLHNVQTKEVLEIAPAAETIQLVTSYLDLKEVVFVEAEKEVPWALERRVTETDSEGEATLTLPRGTNLFSISREGYRTLSDALLVVGARSRLEVELRSVRRDLRVTVEGIEGARVTVPNVLLTAIPLEGPIRIYRNEDLLYESKRPRFFLSLRKGDKLRVEAPDGTPLWLHNLTSGEKEKVPAKESWTIGEAMGAGHREGVLTDAAGKAVLEGLAVKPNHNPLQVYAGYVLIEKKGYESRPYRAVYTPWQEEQKAWVKLLPTGTSPEGKEGTVRIRLLTTEAKPLVGYWIDILRPDGSVHLSTIWGSRTDEGGTVSLTLPAGWWGIGFYPNEYLHVKYAPWFDVRAGEETVVDVVVPSRMGTVHVDLRDATTGKPIEQSYDFISEQMNRHLRRPNTRDQKSYRIPAGRFGMDAGNAGSDRWVFGLYQYSRLEAYKRVRAGDRVWVTLELLPDFGWARLRTFDGRTGEPKGASGYFFGWGLPAEVTRWAPVGTHGLSIGSHEWWTERPIGGDVLPVYPGRTTEVLVYTESREEWGFRVRCRIKDAVTEKALTGKVRVEWGGRRTDITLVDGSFELESQSGRQASLRLAVEAEGYRGAERWMYLVPGRTESVTLQLVPKDAEKPPVVSDPKDGSPAVLELVSVPEEIEWTVGRRGRLTFRVRNAGGMPGRFRIPVSVPGIYSAVLGPTLLPGEERDMTIRFAVPGNLDTRRDQVTIKVEGKHVHVPFSIRGAEIEVEAKLDKPFYREGERARLTMRVTNIGSTAVEGFTRIQLGTFYRAQGIALQPGAAVTVWEEVPVRFDGNKLLFGVYLTGGRSIYLDAYHLYRRYDLIGIAPDRQVYDQGATVRLRIEAERAGTLELRTFSGWTNLPPRSSIEAGENEIRFALPREMRSGAHVVEAVFTSDGEEVRFVFPIDVRGYHVVIKEVCCFRDRYAPRDGVDLHIGLEASRDMRVTLRGLVQDPSARAVGETKVLLDLVKGPNKVRLLVPYSSRAVGTHRVDYRFLVDLENQPSVVLAAHFQAIDVQGEIPPESTDTDGDGMTDEFEIRYALNPRDPKDALEDSDRDGVRNVEEFKRGTDPRNPDTDGDGFSDGDEIAAGADPRNRADRPKGPAPELLFPREDAAVSMREVAFSWKPVEGAKKYDIEIAADEGFAKMVRTESPAFTTVTLAVDGEGTYYWRVRVDPDGAWSKVRRFERPPAMSPPIERPAPALPPELVSPAWDAALSTRKITLSWKPVEGAEKYDVEIALDAHFARMVRTESPAASNFTVELGGEGVYYWRVRVDPDGPWSTASRFVLDTVPATCLLSAAPAYADFPGAISGTAKDDRSGVERVELWITNPEGRYWDGQAWVEEETKVIAGGTANWKYAFDAVEEGKRYRVRARAVDRAGNLPDASTEASFLIDRTPPVSSISQHRGLNDGRIRGTALDEGSGIARVEVLVRLGRSYWDKETSSWVSEETWNLAEGKTEWTFPFSPQNGETYEVGSRAWDAAGNREAKPAQANLTFLTSEPESWITTSGSVRELSFIVGGSTGKFVEVAIQAEGLWWTGTGWGRQENWLRAAGGAGWSYPFSAAEGVTYTVYSRATLDSAVESTPGKAVFVLDVTPPRIKILTKGALGSATYAGRIELESEEGARLFARVVREETGLSWDGEGWGAAESWREGPGISLILQEGKYVISAYAVDRAGNRSKVLKEEILYDVEAPISTLDEEALQRGEIRGRVLDPGFSAGIERVEVEVRADGKTIRMNAVVDGEAWRIPGPRSGRFSVLSRAIDRAGNIETKDPEAAVEVTVASPAPGGGGGGGSCGMVGLDALLLLALFWLRRGGRIFGRGAAVASVLAVLVGCMGGGASEEGSRPVVLPSEIPPDDDLSDPGIPAEKESWVTGREIGYQGPGDAATAFSIDEVDYVVLSKSLHGTVVAVAIHDTAPAQPGIAHSPESFAEAIFKIFHNAWHVFGGFPLDGYLFKIRAVGDDSTFSLSRGGVALPAPDYGHLDQAHEILHAWNGKTFQYQPDGTGNLFQLETWITEGSTIYLSNRIDGIVVGPSVYSGNMQGLWAQYLDRKGTVYDLSYEALAAQASPTGMTGSEYGKMLDSRGDAFNYLLDRELRKGGSSMNALLRRLYVDFGLNGIQYTQADVEAVLEDLTGASWKAFLDKYLRTNAPLDEELGGGFPFLSS